MEPQKLTVMKHRKSDILWKVILEEVLADLLRFIYSDADQVYDMDRGFEFLDKELAELSPQPELENSLNPFSHVIMAARIRLMEERVTEDILLDIKVKAARKLFAKGFDIVKVRAIFNFLNNYVLFEKPETNRKFYSEVKETDKSITMNTDDFTKMLEREEIARRMLEKSNLPMEQIAELTNVPIKVVKEIKEELGIH